MARHKGAAETGGESGRRLGHALLGAGDARRVAREEVVHRLRRGEFRDRRHDAVRVRRQHDEVFRLAAAAGQRSIRDRFDRIGAARVLGERGRVEIKFAREGVHHDVLKHSAPMFRGCVDFRLGLSRKLDHLGVAAAFEVEEAILGPAMFIIADQRARSVCRERGLAGARQAEEDRRIVLAGRIDRAVHRHHALVWQQVVKDREDRFLGLASIGRPANEDDAFREVDGNHRLGARAVPGRIGAEARAVDDGEIGAEGFRFVRGWNAQEMADKQRVPGVFGDNGHRHAVVKIRAAKEVLRIHLLFR